MEEVGDLSLIQGEFEWKIINFLQLPSVLASPAFSFCGISWNILLVPNTVNCDESVKWIHIVAKSITVPITVDYSFCFKMVNGETFAEYTGTHYFTNVDYVIGAEIMPRSSLIERHADLLPSGVLTIICTLKKNGINSKVGSTSVDEYTQTEEGIGILKLQEHFQEIMQNENVSDVVLKVNDQEFKSHRCVLAARSPVFLAMMSHEMKEKNTGVVDIHDVDSNTFSDFLRYLYTGNEKVITSENVVQLFTTADKYQVNELKKSCFEYMLTHLSVDNFCDVLRLSLEYVEKSLTDACSQFFVENSLPILKTPKWLLFVKDNYVAANELHIKQHEYNLKMKT